MENPLPPDLLKLWHTYLRTNPHTPFYGHLFDSMFKGKLFPLQRKSELLETLTFVCNVMPVVRPVIMEIGVDKGGTFFHFINALCPRIAIGCEIRGTPWLEPFKDYFDDCEFLAIRDSKESDKVKTFLNGNKIDLLFIDGDKSKFAEDFHRYEPFLAPEAIVLMHDMQDEAPRRAFDSIKGYNKSLIIINHDWLYMGEPECDHDRWLLHWKGRSCGFGILIKE